MCVNTNAVLNVNSCDSFVSPSGNYVWNVSGSYVDTISNNIGCDSIITINLNIFQSPNISITSLRNTTFCHGDSVTLSATPGLTTYQWYRWNNAISGATSLNYTAKSRGRYRCIAQNASLCSDTSNAIIVNVPCIPHGPNHQRTTLNNEIVEDGILIFPNPSDDDFYLQGTTSEFIMTDIAGKRVQFEREVIDDQTIIIKGLSSGVYFLRIADDSNSRVFKLVKM